MRSHRPLLLLVALILATTPISANQGEVFYPKRALLDQFPREVKLGGTITLNARLRKGFHSPVLSVTQPNGRTTYLRPDRTIVDKAVFEVEFTEGKGAYRVELVVDSKRGDTTAAQFTIWVGVRRPTATPSEVKKKQSDYEQENPSESPIRLERKLFRLLNEYRTAQGLKPLPWLERAAILGREHWRSFLKMEPLPKKLTHLIPGHGAIADQFEDVYAWPQTARKFPIADPIMGPEATCYCSESLAIARSLTWLFHEYFLRESAFRAPVISEYPTHVAVAIVRDEGKFDIQKYGDKYTPRSQLCTAVIYVQVNSTRVQRELERHWREVTDFERKERDPAKKAALLRALGRLADPRSARVYKSRLTDRRTEIRAAALDALFLNSPERAVEWVEKQIPKLVRARRDDTYSYVIPILRTFANLEYDAAGQARGEQELDELTALSDARLKAAVAQLDAGEVKAGHEALQQIVKRFSGLAAAKAAKGRIKAIERDPDLRSKLQD